MSRDSGPCFPGNQSSFVRLPGGPRPAAVLVALGLVFSAFTGVQVTYAAQGITKAAASSCRLKLEQLEAAASGSSPLKKQPSRFSQQEINSYLALDLSSNYSPSLKSLAFTFEEDKLQGDAEIDFDRLGMSTSKLLSKLMASMFSGIHKLCARGRIVAQNGVASFQLEDAKFDGTSLPNFLVEEIITAVGRKQKPPFDPLQPSPMPFRINKVLVHQSYILVYQ